MSYRQSIKINNQKSLVKIMELCTKLEDLGVNLESEYEDLSLLVNEVLQKLNEDTGQYNAFANVAIISLKKVYAQRSKESYTYTRL